ncbi:hypothetical protein Q0Z83_046780 [Actinoplanes sichuanensis]|uniref:HEAT repeat domain-containing protein n=1 Tax=Actinoplanes sichuanensis TaxID=512349 RepID=A0ABW4AAS3_9ACTN|nr:HEAT repeat domain-containing protein [Actinoplanes sichuanensis]BEL06487.1 hypothetical protein Q0Z83_046780 [Actinoplanes sichuanensis]
MTESTPAVRHEVAFLLRRFAATTVFERRTAVRGIATAARRSPSGSAEQEAIAHALVCAAQDADVRVRLGAVRGLARLTPQPAAATVAPLILDDDYTVREAAVRTLVELDSSHAVPMLVAASRDARVPVRCAALIGLRKIREVDTSVLEALVAGLSDPDPSVQGAAMASLRTLARRSAHLAATITELGRQGLTADSSYRREISLELLRRLAVPGHRERCRSALRDPAPNVRRRAERSR